MQDNVKEAITFRNNSEQSALPIRRWGSFLPGQGLGGSFVHWNGQSFPPRWQTSFIAPHDRQRYGNKFLDACGPELTIQDWGVTYAELEPHYDRFEYLLGTSGKAGNINGQIQPGGNPFEAPRAREISDPADEGDLLRRHIPQRRERSRLPPLPAALGESKPALHQSCRLKSASSASSADSASVMPASTTPRRALRQPSCRSCFKSPTTSCGQIVKCCA